VLIIVGRESEDFYRSLKPRQEANGKDRVMLDRRSSDRRRRRASRWRVERRAADRRIPLSPAENALMNVLGFTVLQRQLQVISREPVVRKPLSAKRRARNATRPTDARRSGTGK
jgi:hypothetical protein